MFSRSLCSSSKLRRQSIALHRSTRSAARSATGLTRQQQAVRTTESLSCCHSSRATSVINLSDCSLINLLARDREKRCQ